MHQSYWRPIAGLVAVLSLSAGVPMAQAEPVSFTLVNTTSRALEEFYASPPSTESWEEDILGGGILLPGEAVTVTIDDGREDCLYDFKGVLGPGENVGRGALIQSEVSVCEGGTYEYSENYL